MLLRRSALVTAGCAVLAAVTGCSSGTTIGAPTPAEATKPAATIFNDGIGAMRTAKSVHIKGPITTIQFDADVGGGNFNGTVTQAGNVFNIVYLAGAGGDSTKARIYLKAAAAVWTAMSTAALGACVGDTWLQLDPATAAAGTSTPQGAAQLTADAGQLGNLTGLADAIGGSPGVLSKGAVGSVNGVNAVQVSSNSGGTVYVATDGPPVIVRISSASSTGGPPANLDFSMWNAGAQFSPPANPKALTAVLAGCPGAAAAQSPAASPSPSP